MSDGGEDPQFIARLRRREEGAFTEFVRMHQLRVFRIVRRFVRDDAEAEDVAQEVFVSVWKAIGDFRGDSKLSTWLYRIATNHVKNRVQYLARRQHGRQDAYEEGDGHAGAASPNSAPDEALDGKRAEARLDAALASLDEEQRVLVVLRDVENLSYEEIQEVTGLPAGTVKSRLHRARQTLMAGISGGDTGTPGNDAKKGPAR